MLQLGMRATTLLLLVLPRHEQVHVPLRRLVIHPLVIDLLASQRTLHNSCTTWIPFERLVEDVVFVLPILVEV